nr:unnamed protein product [Callosobruchus analis]
MNDVFQHLVDKLSEYFSPKQNSAFERHVFRNLRPEEGENVNKFLLRTRQQARKCSFGATVQEATEIHIKDKLIDSWAPLELKRKLLEKERSLDEIVEMRTVKGYELWEVDEKPNQTLKGYASGQALDIKHKFQTTISVKNGKVLLAHFYVLPRGEISILGKETAKRLGVLKLRLYINAIEEEMLFPKIKNIVIKLTIDSTVKPVRRVPASLEEKVEAKLEQLEQQTDIIERVLEPSQWISPIVTVFKPNEDIRICVDMRRATEDILRENYPLPTFELSMTKLRKAKCFSRLDLTSAYHQLEL